MIRVVIAEDQAMVLGALAALLETEPGIEVVGRASTGDAALSLVREHAPDVLVTDIEMPGSSGLDVAAEVAHTAYLSEAISKLGTKNRVEAANLAKAKGWL